VPADTPDLFIYLYLGLSAYGRNECRRMVVARSNRSQIELSKSNRSCNHRIYVIGYENIVNRFIKSIKLRHGTLYRPIVSSATAKGEIERQAYR